MSIVPREQNGEPRKLMMPSPRNNLRPKTQRLDDAHILRAFHDCFQGREDEVK